jgi:hypothetical protein
MRVIQGTYCRSPSSRCRRVSLGCSISRTCFDAELLADVGGGLGAGQARIGHHRPQGGQPGLGEEETRRAEARVKPHQPAREQPLGG